MKDDGSRWFLGGDGGIVWWRCGTQAMVVNWGVGGGGLRLSAVDFGGRCAGWRQWITVVSALSVVDLGGSPL